MNDELDIITDFLKEVSNHDFADVHDVLEGCRDTVERLGLTKIYHDFRAARLDIGTYSFGLDGGVIRTEVIGEGE